MDQHRFDALARTVGEWTTRRGALALLAGLGLGSFGTLEVEARKNGRCKPSCPECSKCKKGKCKKKKNGKKKCKKGKCQLQTDGTACTGGGSCCNGTCCSANQVCQTGSCFPKSTCPATQTGLCPGGVPTVCGADPGGTCACSVSAEGNVVCITVPTGATCMTLTPCTSSATCPTGQACAEVGSCCAGTPARACFAPCPAPTVASDPSQRATASGHAPLLTP